MMAWRIEPLAEPATFAEFCQRHGIEVVVRERSKHMRLPRWYASAPGVEVREGGYFLGSRHGNGQTPDEAVADYARCLAGERIVLDDGRLEINAPNEWSS